VDPRQTSSYSYSGLSSSSAARFTPSSYESLPASYSSSSIPQHLPSLEYPGDSQFFGSSGAGQGFAARPLAFGNLPADTFNSRNMRASGSGLQELSLENCPQQKSARPRHARATVPSPMLDSSNLPDFETFLKAQDHLAVELKGDNHTLPRSQKILFAKILHISAAQLEFCIKARHEILPILNDLISASTNLGMPTDQVLRWLGRVESQSSTEKPTIDSAYHSNVNTLSGEHVPKKKRKLNARESSSKSYQCTYIDTNGEYCLREFRDSTDWKRHEETHWPQKRWECLIEGSNSTASCHICSGNIDLAGQQVMNDHAGCVGRTLRHNHSFPRKDKLKLHVKNFHDCIANVDTWYTAVASGWKRQCGFCGSTLTGWGARCEHVGLHFMEGKRMLPDWRDPWHPDAFTFNQGSDDDNDDNDDNDEHDEDEEDNYDDNDGRFNTREGEPDHDGNDRPDNGHGGPGSFQKDISNGGMSSNHEGQRRKTCSNSNDPGVVDGGYRESEDRIGGIGNGPWGPYTLRRQGGEQAKLIFKHIRKLGYGSFGAVDEVEHYASKMHFARKTVRVSPRRSASSLAQAQREVTALRRLKHQHIINVLASYKWEGHLAIIMFPVAERNLSEFLHAENATTLPQISKLCAWVGCLTSAVSYIHGNFCYHMDLKPNNILIYGNHVMLADFGGALIMESSQSNDTLERASITTPMYCAPEIAYPDASLVIPGASDIYSLGCVFLEMATVIHREKLQTFVDFRTFGSTNAIYNNTRRKTWMWIEHLSYIDESLGLPQQTWHHVIKRMLSINSKIRPTAKEIVQSHFINGPQEKKEKLDEEKYLVAVNTASCLALIEAARLWLEECRTSHRNCHTSMTKFVPSRILDVGTHRDLIQLRSTFGGFSSPYVALSHCWGAGGEILKTTTQTLESMTSGIAVSSLPPTFANAVHLTKALGFSYLWIDSLCIIQDSKEDWMTECSRMGNIYSHSSLTICATSGGQYPINTEPRLPQSKPVLNESKSICSTCSNGHTAFKPLSEDTATTMLLDSPWFKRAWILQEIVLSPRKLLFSSTSIAWECFSSCTTLNTVGRIGKALRLLPVQRNRFSGPNIGVPRLTAQAPNDYMKIWRDIVREYSKRKLSNAQDKLPALAGIASKIAEHTGQIYLAGLWVEDILPTGLLWSRDFATIPLTRPQYRAPSWSWASIDSPVSWSKSLPEENVVSEAEILYYKISLHSSILSPFGAVSSGYIEIKGPLKRVTVTRVGSEHLLKRQSLTPFAFAQWDVLEEEQEASGLDGVKQNQGWMPWCLNTVKGVGLILRQQKTGYFQRVGIFWIQDEWVSETETNDDWELRTITII
jgi:serine/threonine protein kinase